jgi:hypothetical protein
MGDTRHAWVGSVTSGLESVTARLQSVTQAGWKRHAKGAGKRHANELEASREGIGKE